MCYVYFKKMGWGRGGDVTSSSFFSPLKSLHPSKHELVIVGLLASSSVNADEHIMSCCVQSNMISETVGYVSITSSRCNFIITEAKSLTCRKWGLVLGDRIYRGRQHRSCKPLSKYAVLPLVTYTFIVRDIMLYSMEVWNDTRFSKRWQNYNF